MLWALAALLGLSIYLLIRYDLSDIIENLNDMFVLQGKHRALF